MDIRNVNEEETELERAENCGALVALGVVVAVMLLVLYGCGAAVKVTANDNTPRPVVTKTVSETIRVQKPVPVYRLETEQTTTTRTIDSNGRQVGPLHEVKAKSPPGDVVPDAGK